MNKARLKEAAANRRWAEENWTKENGMTPDQIIEWESKTMKAREDMFYLLQNLEKYKINRGAYPTTEEGLKALTKAGEEEHEQVIVSYIPKDPWGNAYQYAISETEGPVVTCLGADGQVSGDGNFSQGPDRDLYVKLKK